MPRGLKRSRYYLVISHQLRAPVRLAVLMTVGTMTMLDSFAHDAGTFGSILSRVVKDFGDQQHRRIRLDVFADVRDAQERQHSDRIGIAVNEDLNGGSHFVLLSLWSGFSACFEGCRARYGIYGVDVISL
jgi:hypothetical protein